MNRSPTLRLPAAWAWVVGLTLGACGCGGQQSRPDPPTSSGPAAAPPPTQAPPPASPDRPPQRIDVNSAAGQEAVEFLTAVAAGSAPARRLSAGFVRLVGLPVELPADKERGYSPDAAETWLRRVGARLTGLGPMTEAHQAGDVAVFRGSFTGGSYWLRMVREGDGWKADWLSLSSVPLILGRADAATSGDALLREFAAAALAAAICDQDAMPREERVAVVAAGLTPAFRSRWADPFAGDRAKGYDYSPAQLGVRIDALGKGAGAVTVAPAGDSQVQVEIARGGQKAAYTFRLVRGTGPGQWLVDAIDGP